jgi:hypothetical protein
VCRKCVRMERDGVWVVNKLCHGLHGSQETQKIEQLVPVVRLYFVYEST